LLLTREEEDRAFLYKWGENQKALYGRKEDLADASVSELYS